MPCYDPRDDMRASNYDLAVMEDRLNKLTNLLCSVGRALHNNKPLPIEAVEYFKQHRVMDEKAGRPW